MTGQAKEVKVRSLPLSRNGNPCVEGARAMPVTEIFSRRKKNGKENLNFYGNYGSDNG